MVGGAKWNLRFAQMVLSQPIFTRSCSSLACIAHLAVLLHDVVFWIRSFVSGGASWELRMIRSLDDCGSRLRDGVHDKSSHKSLFVQKLLNSIKCL